MEMLIILTCIKGDDVISDLDNIQCRITLIKKHKNREKLMEYYLLHLICNIKYDKLCKESVLDKEYKRVIYCYRRNANYYMKRFYNILKGE